MSSLVAGFAHVEDMFVLDLLLVEGEMKRESKGES